MVAVLPNRAIDAIRCGVIWGRVGGETWSETVEQGKCYMEIELFETNKTCASLRQIGASEPRGQSQFVRDAASQDI
jgi:hypothetical protein